MYEDVFLLVKAHPHPYAGDERRTYYRASFCMLDHEAHYSVWDRPLAIRLSNVSTEPIKMKLLSLHLFRLRYLLVFYIGNILVDKNTLCDGCFLTGFRFYSKSSSNMDSVSFHAMCLVTSF
jgi:hypothetical protein